MESLYYDSSMIDCEYSAMLDSIKHRINQLDKNIEEEQQERKVLKRAYKDINNIIISGLVCNIILAWLEIWYAHKDVSSQKFFCIFC